MKRRLIRALVTGVVSGILSTGMWMTAWADTLVPAMNLPEVSGQTGEHTVGIPGAIEEGTVTAEAVTKPQGTIAGTEGAKEQTTGSAVKTAGRKSGQTAAGASAQKTASEETGAAAENSTQSSKVIAGKGVREAEAEAEAEREALAQVGPGIKEKKNADKTANLVPARGTSLGIFKTTGYCTCEQCIGDSSGLTYSGTVPKARHTVSADISLYPVGTRLMIGDVVYTVEDTGSNIAGNWIDIYYESHEEAFAHGVQMQEVFTVMGES